LIIWDRWETIISCGFLLYVLPAATRRRRGGDWGLSPQTRLRGE